MKLSDNEHELSQLIILFMQNNQEKVKMQICISDQPVVIELKVLNLGLNFFSMAFLITSLCQIETESQATIISLLRP